MIVNPWLLSLPLLRTIQLAAPKARIPNVKAVYRATSFERFHTYTTICRKSFLKGKGTAPKGDVLIGGKKVIGDTNILPSMDIAALGSNLRKGDEGHNNRNAKRRRVDRKPKKPVGDGSTEEVLDIDVRNMLASAAGELAADGVEDMDATSSSPAADEAEKRNKSKSANTKVAKTLPSQYSIIELTIHELSSTGDGLAYSPTKDHIYVVPFTLPGDTVEAKVYKHFSDHSLTDLVKVLTPAPQRDDALIGCKYFASCSGCQFQMLPYEDQLQHKRRVIEKAYENFSGLSPAMVPEIGPTWASPLKYGYRTKLTPHFDGPRKGGFPPDTPTPDIGFMRKGTRRVIDIEDCPIGTDAVREGMREQRKWVAENLHTFKRGATLLLRESTIRKPGEEADANGLADYVEEKLCITDSKELITEYVGPYIFQSPAGSFFQNNNSILEEFTSFVRDNLHLPVPITPENPSPPAPCYLVDAYCGSGLFSIVCGRPFTKVIGVDVSPDGIAHATHNANLNNLTNTTFIQGNAESIFASITFPGEDTSVIIDPPRKGSDKKFLDQLLDLRPKRIVYVSCNVHTQARDLGYFLNDERGSGYRIDSIRGFDFFPQTHHVESVAVLTRVI